jgi:exopolyphosphatase/guanosine-5'-triphosphate,3'-diphosphate pyrophosphatase
MHDKASDMAKRRAGQLSGVGYRLKAVIDVGSTSIRMVVAQVQADGRFELLDSLSQSVTLGRDTFTTGEISRATTEDCVAGLRNFSSVLGEYGIRDSEDIRAVATSAVREARNRDAFLDRVYIGSGISVEAIDGAEINRLTFLAVRPLLEQQQNLQEGALLIAELGGGSTEILGLQDGRVSFAHTYRMGSYRLWEALSSSHISGTRQLDVLDTEIASGVSRLCDLSGGSRRKAKLLLMGGEVRLAAQQLSSSWDGASVVALSVARLETLAGQILELGVEKSAQRHHLALEEAQTLGPALRAYVCMARAFGVKRVFVCGVSLRDGLIAESASGATWTEDFVGQILNSIRELSEHYHIDQPHADCVTAHAVALFGALTGEHKLTRRHEVLLMVAAQLHDIGMFVGTSGHHKHSKYLIQNSDIFGLSQRDIGLVALIARYHRRAVPRASHDDYRNLPRADRLVVSKLAAILRVADALDRSHTQVTGGVRIRLPEGSLLLEVTGGGNVSAERRSLAYKGAMFEQVSGRTAVLRQRKR